jgi:diguanylate cyclase (GGDEF)-like protein
MHSLQTKIFFFFVILLISVQSIALWTINRATNEQSQQSINARLTTAETIFQTLFQSESEKLSAIAKTAAQDGGLKENFYEDERSFLVALNNHRKRINADIVIAINDQAKIKAQLVNQPLENQKTKVIKGPEIGELFRFVDWLDFSEEGLLYPLNNDLYQLSLAPIKSGQENIGWIAFGFLIDKNRAIEFAKLTGLTTDFIIKNIDTLTHLASSSEARTSDILLENILHNRLANEFIGTFIQLGEVGVSNKSELKVVLHGSRKDLLATIQNRWFQFLALASITLLLSLAGAYLIAASISKPVRQLVSWAQFIAKGNYNEPVTIDDKGEMGQLANEFSVMQSEIINRERTITYTASHDSLTNLPNRYKLLDTLKVKMSDQNNKLALILINISHIKQINSSLGHDVGDQVIKQVALRLSGVNHACSLFHVGADEFVLLLNNNEVSVMKNCYNSIRDALELPYINKAMNLELRFRSGVSFFPEQSNSAEELLQKADTAMHYAKSKKVRFQIYDPTQEVNTLEQLNLMNDLSIAINDGQLVLYYQPKITLNNKHTETVEALVRWQHPERGIIPPDKFISIAESTGQINPLTFWVLEAAASQYVKWLKKGIDLVIAVNISVENLKAPKFYELVCGVLEKHAIPVKAIMLEITESAVVDDPLDTIRLLQKFKQHGFKLSIDDYGTGYSSLAQLKDLPVDELKIDMSFILKLPDDPGDKIIVRSTIDLAHSMGLTVVAEGVENERALQWLSDRGCERAQGYYISRPVPAEEFEAWLSTTSFYKPNEE